MVYKVLAVEHDDPSWKTRTYVKSWTWPCTHVIKALGKEADIGSPWGSMASQPSLFEESYANERPYLKNRNERKGGKKEGRMGKELKERKRRKHCRAWKFTSLFPHSEADDFLWVHGQPGLHSEFQASQGYII